MYINIFVSNAKYEHKSEKNGKVINDSHFVDSFWASTLKLKMSECHLWDIFTFDLTAVNDVEYFKLRQFWQLSTWNN